MPASPQIAYRALLERAGRREPADRGGVDSIGPRHVGHRLARSKALKRLLALVGSHLAGTTELDATGLRTGSALAGPGGPRAENAANFFRWAANAPFEQGAVGDLR